MPDQNRSKWCPSSNSPSSREGVGGRAIKGMKFIIIYIVPTLILPRKGREFERCPMETK
jgi:hypothetical protein